MALAYIPVNSNYLEIFNALTSNDERSNLIIAILEYIYNNKTPELDGGPRVAFAAIKPDIDRAQENYDRKCAANAENGRKGGRPKNQSVMEEQGSSTEASEFSKKPKNPVGFSETQKTLIKYNLTNLTNGEKISPPISPQGESESFARFWEAYPRKINRSRAWRAWKELDPDNELEGTIMAAVREQSGSAQWKQEGGRFIPSPDKWLSDQRWKDKLPSAGLDNKSYDIGEIERLSHLRLPDEL